MKKFDKPVRKIKTVREPLGIKTIPEMIENSTQLYKDRTAFLIPRNNSLYELSFNQVFESVTRLGRHLNELGLSKGDNIAILGDNRPEWGISYFSVAWIGAVAVPLDARSSIESHKFILRYSSVKAIILSSSFFSKFQSFVDDLQELQHIVVMENFDEIFKMYSSGIEKVTPSENDLLQILFTSGTTGNPKGVMLTHGNIMSNVEDIYKVIDLGPEDRAFSVLPIHHSYECTCGLVGPFYNGSSVFYSRSLKPRDMLEDLYIASPTVWLNAPLLLEKLYIRIYKELSNQKGLKRLITRTLPNKLIGRKIKKQLGLDRIKFIICGGAALPSWVSSGLEGYGFPIIQGYGLSETSPLISINPPSNPKNQSVGMIIESDEVEIRDIDEDGNGEIVVRGPNIMKGYYKNETATKEVLQPDGWLCTGDLGYFDDDGYLYVTGRKKFLIVTRGGKNLFPEEVEEKLTKSTFIEEALVFSPDDKTIQALIYPNIDEVNERLGGVGEETSDENVWNLIRLEVRKMNKDLEAYKKISNFAIRFEEFPKTTTRKIKRHLFKDMSLKPEEKVIRD
ncbi:AMP-binding protein [Desulfobacterota bacterium AH_259_B03_O07]|nr:AMP-binding protein [Desulfobacterota bacterium AH_259_B03_O07]